MKEDFLHYLWQYQKFDKSGLVTVAGDPLSISSPGFYNTDAGPDFLEGYVRIGTIDWFGQIEIHLKSSDWYRHAHEVDPAYQNVILHVVWEHDREVLNVDGRPIPTLELQHITASVLRKSYKSLLENTGVIPCESHFAEVAAIKKLTMLERTLMQRLERKSLMVSELLTVNNQDLEETAYQLLMGNFGFKLNNEAFLKLAKAVPFRLLKKYSNNSIQIEALLFGMAGFLEDTEDDYAQKLKKEFKFLSVKHGLTDKIMVAAEWKFMRTRPSNFPTVRLSQLAAFLGDRESIFSSLTGTDSPKLLEKYLRVEPSEYWKEHYHFGRKSGARQKGMGKSSSQNLIVNTAVPLLVAYATYLDDRDHLEKAISLLEEIPAEKNRITEIWQSLHMEMKTMADSQGGIELYNEFCRRKKCTACAVGVSILG